MMIIGFVISVIMLTFAMINDFKSNTIKNIIPLTGLIGGIVLSIFTKNSLLISVATCIAFFIVLFYIPRKIGITEFIGAGDIKLYMALTFLLGTKFSIYTFLYSIVIGTIFLLVINFKRFKNIYFNILSFFVVNKQSTAKIIDNNKANIFSPYIFIGTILTFVQYMVLKNDWLFNILFA